MRKDKSQGSKPKTFVILLYNAHLAYILHSSQITTNSLLIKKADEILFFWGGFGDKQVTAILLFTKKIKGLEQVLRPEQIATKFINSLVN